jgi:membrane-associated protease RseP (regulator of RpoE activity)
MRSPKHLWSGDWERESAALSEELAGRRPAARRVAAPASVEAQPGPEPRAPRQRRRSPRVNLALLIGLTTLIVVAAAGYGISRLADSSSSAQETSATANQTGPIEWLGMQVEGVPPGNVVIATVPPGSAGEQAGLDPGDELLSINGRAVNTVSDIGAAISGLHPGDSVTIQISRGSTQLTTRATLGAPPSHHP